MRFFKRDWKWLLLAVCLAFVVFFRRDILVAAGRWLDVGKRPRAATYALVLPGGPETRPFVATAMYRQGLIQAKVLVPRNEADPLVQDGILPPYHELIRRILNARGVPDSRIRFLGTQSSSTWTDANLLAEVLHNEPQATVAIITNDFRTRRSRWAFRRILGNDFDRVFFVSAPMDRYSAVTV